MRQITKSEVNKLLKINNKMKIFITDVTDEMVYYSTASGNKYCTFEKEADYEIVEDAYDFLSNANEENQKTQKLINAFKVLFDLRNPEETRKKAINTIVGSPA